MVASDRIINHPLLLHKHGTDQLSLFIELNGDIYFGNKTNMLLINTL